MLELLARSALVAGMLVAPLTARSAPVSLSPSAVPTVSPGGRGLGTGAGAAVAHRGEAARTDASASAEAGSSSTRAGSELATVRVRFEGLPAGGLAASLDPAEELVFLRLWSRSGDSVTRAITLEGLDRPVELRFRRSGTARLSVHLGSARFGPSYLELELETGAVHEVSIDLDGERALPVRVEGIPGSAGGRAWLTTWASAGRSSAADGRFAAVGGDWPSRLDADGTGWTVPRGGHPPRLVLETRDGSRRSFDLVTESLDGGLWTLRTAHRVIELAAPEGSDLVVERGCVAGLFNGGYGDRPRHHRTYIALDPEVGQTVFVDGERIGCISASDLQGHTDDVVQLDECELPSPAPNLVIHVKGPVSPDAQLWIQRAFDPVLDPFDALPQRLGAIVPVGESARNAKTLGFWSLDGSGGLRVEVTVPPGRYHLALDGADQGVPDLALLDPVQVEAGRLRTVLIDVASAEEHVIAMRIGPDLRVAAIDGPTLAIGASRVRSGRPGHVFRDRAGEWWRLADGCVRLWTLGGSPGSATLFDCAGGAGRVVDLLPKRLREGNPDHRYVESDLVAALPELRHVRAEAHALVGGSLFGWCDQVPREAEPGRYRLVAGHHHQRTVQCFRDGSVRIWLRGPEATGVLLETRHGGRPLLRDWWRATPDGVTFLGDTEGRFIELQLDLARPARLLLVPRDNRHGFRPEFVADASPGESVRAWVPNSAARLIAMPLPRRSFEDLYLGPEIEFQPDGEPLASVSLQDATGVIVIR